jgi:hypothetical protein
MAAHAGAVEHHLAVVAGKSGEGVGGTLRR